MHYGWMPCDCPMPKKSFEEKSSLWLKIVGWACVVVGLLGIVLPIIPGIPFLIAGMATLSTQHKWVRALTLKLKTRFRRFFRKNGREK
jgi:uncharacterized membrane protein YbaN (DUF454 family)